VEELAKMATMYKTKRAYPTVFPLAYKALQLYGNRNISLTQAIAYANTPEKRQLCKDAIIKLSKNKMYMGKNVLPTLIAFAITHFPKLNHREQA
jgi:hypothetical protein